VFVKDVERFAEIEAKGIDYLQSKDEPKVADTILK